MIKVLFVCLGNICRSPMAQIVFENIVKNKGLENFFEIDSAGTEAYNERMHAGIHRGTKEVFRSGKAVTQLSSVRPITRNGAAYRRNGWLDLGYNTICKYKLQYHIYLSPSQAQIQIT